MDQLPDYSEQQAQFISEALEVLTHETSELLGDMIDFASELSSLNVNEELSNSNQICVCRYQEVTPESSLTMELSIEIPPGNENLGNTQAVEPEIFSFSTSMPWNSEENELIAVAEPESIPRRSRRFATRAPSTKRSKSKRKSSKSRSRSSSKRRPSKSRGRSKSKKR